MDYHSATSGDDNGNPSPKFDDFRDNRGMMGSWKPRWFNFKVKLGILLVLVAVLFWVEPSNVTVEQSNVTMEPSNITMEPSNVTMSWGDLVFVVSANIIFFLPFC
jgi:hypothetical protein